MVGTRGVRTRLTVMVRVGTGVRVGVRTRMGVMVKARMGLGLGLRCR